MLKTIFSFLSGALLTLSFAPFNIDSFVFILPAIVLFIFLRSSAKKALWYGTFFGIGFFGTGASWIYISIHQFGNTSVLLAAFITLLFIIVMSLYPATLGYIFRKLFSHFSDAVNCLFVFPLLWVLWEYFRSSFFTGFPWLLLGYAQLNTPLSGFAPIIGVYGLSFLSMLISGALVLLATKQNRAPKIISFCIIFGLIGAGFILKNHLWTHPTGKPVTVSLIQGNIPQTIKWDANFATHNITVYHDLTLQHLNSQLIIWPEGAFPVYAQEAMQWINTLSAIAKQHHSNIIFGVPYQVNNHYYNGLLLIGENHGVYLKRHLVPFGEYTPLPSVFGKIMAHFQIPMSDFAKGPVAQSELKINAIHLAPFICYEIAFQNEVLDSAENSGILITLSDDSWFGKSIALAQHLQIAQMRSLETGRPQLLSTNTGITAFISPLGEIIKAAPIDQRVVLTETIQSMAGKTPVMQMMPHPKPQSTPPDTSAFGT